MFYLKKKMKDFWNQRYQKENYAYGKLPNVFLREQLPTLAAGKILFPMEGEGRNAVFAAQLGWNVKAFDFSEQAKRKALFLAKQQQVELDYSVADIQEFNFIPRYYDVVGLFFAHPSQSLRKGFHEKVVSTLKLGGKLVLEAFHIHQHRLSRTSGGPKDEAMLYTEEMLSDDFRGLHFHLLESLEIELDEGEFHQGKANVIRLLAEKLA